jgi:aerobic-type carbon monoxide dehydrogenase small subunit (CoxS/CutS family)
MNTIQEQRRLGSLEARQPVTIQVDGEPVQAYAGETVATALLALGLHSFRHTKKGEPRSLFCGMGICFDCLVTVDGVENVRACMTPVAEGMVIATMSGAATGGRADTGDGSHD